MKYLLQSIVYSSIWFSMATYSASVSANLLGGYTVSNNPKPIEQRRSLSSGSRSMCQSNLDAEDIELAVPQQKVVHLTTKTPSLYLLSRVENIPFKFTLVDPQSTKTIAEKDLGLSRGLNKINLDPKINLANRKTYLWFVAFPCQNNPENYFDVLGAGIEKRTLTSQAQADLSQAKNSADRAFVYAQNGFWYDALQETVDSTDSQPLKDIRLSKLLESAGIPYQLK